MVYLNLLWAYLKIGLFGFGGGYAMLSLIQHEAVEVIHYGESSPWLTSKEFTDIVAISQMTPGPYRYQQCHLYRICSNRRQYLRLYISDSCRLFTIVHISATNRQILIKTSK